MRIELYKGRNAKWFWRLRASNGNIQADGSQGYGSLAEVKRGVNDTIDAFRVIVNGPKHLHLVVINNEINNETESQ